MLQYATPVAGPNYAKNAAYLQSQGFQIPQAPPPQYAQGLMAGPPPADYGQQQAAMEAEYRERARQDRARQQQEEAAALAAMRQRFPGVGDAQLMQAMEMDRARQAQQSQESWIEQYGNPYQQQELMKRRAQIAATPKTNEEWVAQQNQMNASSGAPPMAPSRAQPIQPPSQGTPYGLPGVRKSGR